MKGHGGMEGGGSGGSSTVFMNELGGGQSLARPGCFGERATTQFTVGADAEFHCPRGDHFENKKKPNKI